MRQPKSRPSSVEPLEPRRLLSAAPVRFADLAIDEQLDVAGSPNTMVNANGTLFAAITTARSDSPDLWMLDASGKASFVKDVGGPMYNFYPGAARSAFFTVSVSLGFNVWYTDGTDAGTRMIGSVSGTSAAGPTARVPFVRLGANTYFAAGNALYKVSDASPYAATTVTSSTGAASPTVMNGALYFVTSTAAQRGLYRVNDAGTAATLVAATPSSVAGLVNVNGTLYFLANDSSTPTSKLYKSDGTAAGTQVVASLLNLTGNAPLLVGVGDTLYFTARTDAAGTELWKSDGTAAGTGQVIDLRPGAASSDPRNAVALNGKLYFSAVSASQSSRQLWRTDGTPEGTQLLAALDGSATSGVLETSVVNGTLYFAARTTATGTELWRTDGTPAGTQLVSDRYQGKGSSRPHDLTDFNGSLYYQGVDPVLGYALFKSDGTAAGTSIVKDYLPGPFDPLYIANAFATAGDGRLVYVDGDATSTGRELYVTDGTAAGTRLVKDLFPGVLGSSPTDLTNVNGTLLFAAQGATAIGRELWKTDGTPEGTVLVKDIHPNDGNISSDFGSNPDDLVNVNGTLYFSADGDAVHGSELWKSDGTPEGTVPVPGQLTLSNLSPDNLTNVDGTLFFTSGSGSSSTLYKLAPGDTFPSSLAYFRTTSSSGGSTAIRSLRAVNGMLYFAADDGTNGMELWKSDGTDRGTVMVKNIRATYVNGDPSSRPDAFVGLGNWVIFYADDGVTGRELWRTDGTAAGTILLKDIYPNTSSNSIFNGSGASPYVSYNGHVYFAAIDPDHGVELWRTDGTPAGTTLFKDIHPGTANSLARWYGLVGGRFYFAANDGPTGAELWTTDGTDAGTIRVADINPGAGPSTPARFYALNGSVVIFASDGVNPPSLFRFDPETVKPTVAATAFLPAAAKPTLTIDFDEDVASSLAPADLVLLNRTTGQTIDPAAISLAYDPAANRATVTFPGLLDGVLPDGDYRLTLPANVVRDTSNNPLAADLSFDFFILAGDANHDRAVNFTDLLALARNFNQSGKTFADGDFNYDGTVNFSDLLILARKYNQTLAAPPTASLTPVFAPALPTSPKPQDRAANPIFSSTPVTAPAPSKPKPVARPARRA